MQPYNLLELYSNFTDFTPTIPKFYWDVTSQEQRIKAICEEIGKIIAVLDAHGIQINTNTEDIQKLAADLANFKEKFAGEFEQFYKDKIEKWLEDNLAQKISDIVKFVFFGLTDDGYFCATIPESWDFLRFDTGANYADQTTYGRLILEY